MQRYLGQVFPSNHKFLSHPILVYINSKSLAFQNQISSFGNQPANNRLVDCIHIWWFYSILNLALLIVTGTVLPSYPQNHSPPVPLPFFPCLPHTLLYNNSQQSHIRIASVLLCPEGGNCLGGMALHFIWFWHHLFRIVAAALCWGWRLPTDCWPVPDRILPKALSSGQKRLPFFSWDAEISGIAWNLKSVLRLKNVIIWCSAFGLPLSLSLGLSYRWKD